MSHGRAIEMFGVRDEPGKDWRQKSEPSADASIEDRMDITTAPAPTGMLEPKTEYDYRQLNEGQRSTTPLLSEDQQWALFSSKKHMVNAAVLAQQYASIVAEKEAKEGETRKESKPTDKLFGKETLPSWRAERIQCVAKLSSKIKAYKAPEDFDDGLSNHPDPRQYYNGPPIGILDLEKLGIKTKTTKD
ncbi:hypothetical protein K402DRAFT_418749 [Aulographum hederae CBS 113979]|uniref:Uncharacterized protein n=1 Tax=Aulographum hederae CBS 113979 TaxID=1176131 RepID=A0A6G1H8F1_9PEZI|nr:hypothetical protein K402DRAFT_418749 [Aulographum hederae CBS 113979]